MEKLKWQTERRKIKDLAPLSYNPRKLTAERKRKLETSLAKFDLVEIPVINTDDVLVAGNQRVKVMMDLGRGEEMIDVRVPNRALTEAEIKEYNITSNTHVGIWDVDVLEDVFGDIDLESLGVSQKELDALRREEQKGIVIEDDEFSGKIPKEAISVEGDLYELENPHTGVIHRVLCGDATDQDDVQKLMNGKLADLVTVDPPYNVDYEGQKGMKIENDNMEDDLFFQFLLTAFSQLFIYTKKGGCCYVAHSDTEGINFRLAYKEAGFSLRQVLIWNKNSSVLSRQDYNWKHEPILYGWKPGAAHFFMGDFKQDTVLDFKRPARNDLHPTMKPLPLWAQLILNSSRPKELILDSFLGSGTSLIACEQTGRVCYGLEKSPVYCDVIVARWLRYVRKTYRVNGIVRLNGEVLSNEKMDALCQR